MLQKWSQMEGEWLGYRGGQFNGGRMVMLQRWSLMYGERSCYGGGQFKEGESLLWKWPV